MNYSIHTFEITLDLDTKEYNDLKNKAYAKAKGGHRLYSINRDKNRIDDALKKYGIKIKYHHDTYKKRIKFVVNPTKLLGGNDIKKLWKPNEDNISRLLQELNEHIENYFDSDYKLDEFKLTRIDFTVNINVGDEEKVSAYIKVLHKIGKVKGFSPKFKKNDNLIDLDDSFDLEGNSNGIEFSAYDKEAELMKKINKHNREESEYRLKDAKGILRIEARLIKPKSIRKYTDVSNTSKQIKNLALNSDIIFLDIFTQIVPFGDYYKKEEAGQLIKKNIPKRKLREKMLRLMELIPKKKSFYLAKKEMNDRNIDKVMKMFNQIYLSPVTISKRQKIDYLESLYSYLLD